MVVFFSAGCREHAPAFSRAGESGISVCLWAEHVSAAVPCLSVASGGVFFTARRLREEAETVARYDLPRQAGGRGELGHVREEAVRFFLFFFRILLAKGHMLVYS